MYRESEKLHHCVRTYNGRVVMGRSKIFFLRKKEEPEEPYGTIEVQGQRVFQLKGLCNSKVSLEAQNFVRKWAKVKGLTIDSADFN